jgi:hypothetical protein
MVFPWKILNSHLDGISVGGYYSETIQPIIDLPQEEKQRLVLSKGLLGKSKDALDMIDLDVELNSAVNMFGHFLKYEVSDAVVPHDREPSRSAFDVMMAAQRQLCLPRLPPRIQKDTLTKKEILDNDILSLLEEHGLANGGG